jgi:hypothetical protein
MVGIGSTCSTRCKAPLHESKSVLTILSGPLKTVLKTVQTVRLVVDLQTDGSWSRALLVRAGVTETTISTPLCMMAIRPSASVVFSLICALSFPAGSFCRLVRSP